MVGRRYIGVSSLGEDEPDSGLLQMADRSVLLLCTPGDDLMGVSERLLAEDTLVVPARSIADVESLDYVPTQALVDAEVPGIFQWLQRWTAEDEGRVAIGIGDARSTRDLLVAGALVVLPRPLDVVSVSAALDRARRWREQLRSLSELRDRERSNVGAPVVESVLAAVGHEMRNPLAVALANIEYMRDADSREIPPLAFDERRSVIEDTYSALRRIHDLLETVATLVRGTPPQPESVPLMEAVRRVVSLTPVGQARIQVDGDDAVVAWASRSLLEQVLAGLLRRAVEAVGGTKMPKVRLRIYRTASEARITVRDNGPAISSHERLRIFEPTFPTGGSGASGLGLPLLRHAVTRMGGTLTLGPEQGEGRSFRVRLPLAPA